MEYHLHQPEAVNTKREYQKFALIIVGIVALAIGHASWRGFGLMQFLESFMGAFFLVFGAFKLFNLKEFAMGFASYDVIARRLLLYGYYYPFLQLSFALFYLLGGSDQYTDASVLIVSLISSIGVVQELMRGSKIRCVCLGSFIKLPLSRISVVEDFGMAAMAAIMLVLR
jgi:hypothetical protein